MMNPNLNLSALSKTTGIPTPMLAKHIEEGRLSIPGFIKTGQGRGGVRYWIPVHQFDKARREAIEVHRVYLQNTRATGAAAAAITRKANRTNGGSTASQELDIAVAIRDIQAKVDALWTALGSPASGVSRTLTGAIPLPAVNDNFIAGHPKGY